MLRSLKVSMSLTLAIVVLIISGHLEAQESDDPFGPKTVVPRLRPHSAKQVAEKRISSILNQRLKSPLEYEGTPLSEVCSSISDEYDLPVVIDTTALGELAIDTNTEVTLRRLQDVTLRSTLNLMLRQSELEELTFSIEEEVLLVTTKERAGESLLTRVYRVNDFEMHNEPPKGGAVTWANYNTLIDVIISCVEYESWREHGKGEGEMRFVKPGMLVVTQTSSVHLKIENLLANLRAVKDEIRTE